MRTLAVAALAAPVLEGFRASMCLVYAVCSCCVLLAPVLVAGSGAHDSLLCITVLRMFQAQTEHSRCLGLYVLVNGADQKGACHHCC